MAKRSDLDKIYQIIVGRGVEGIAINELEKITRSSGAEGILTTMEFQGYLLCEYDRRIYAYKCIKEMSFECETG